MVPKIRNTDLSCKSYKKFSYAAWMVHGFVEFDDKIKKKEISREIIRNTRMDMDQYDRLFNFYRIAEEDIDVLLDRRLNVLNKDEHIIVMCNQQVRIIF